MTIFENFSAPAKASSGRPACTPKLYQTNYAIARLLVSFRFDARSKSGKIKKALNSHFSDFLVFFKTKIPRFLKWAWSALDRMRIYILFGLCVYTRTPLAPARAKDFIDVTVFLMNARAW